MYDFIIMDCYDGDYIPPPLATKAFMEDVFARLNHEGK